METEKAIIDIRTKTEWVDGVTTKWTKISTIKFLESVVYPNPKLRQEYEELFNTFAKAARETEALMVEKFASKQLRKNNPVRKRFE